MTMLCRMSGDRRVILSVDRFIVQMRGDWFFAGIPFAHKSKLHLTAQVFASRWDYGGRGEQVDIKEMQP
jgi:hypothetical protein